MARKDPCNDVSNSHLVSKQFTLTGPDCKTYLSDTKGTLGGYKRGSTRIYGQLDCQSALRHIAAGHYFKYRVFFADEVSAKSAGFRPCGKCMPEEYRTWKIELQISRQAQGTSED